jgi:putative membrane protein
MLQLTSAAGTFPLEVVPDFFKVINPLLPMTYSVRALRVATTGLDMSMITPNVWMLILFGVCNRLLSRASLLLVSVLVTLNDLASACRTLIRRSREEHCVRLAEASPLCHPMVVRRGH